MKIVSAAIRSAMEHGITPTAPAERSSSNEPRATPPAADPAIPTPTTAAAPPAPTKPLRRDRRHFVISMIVLAVLLFASTETLLYYRWATMVEPTCVLVVDMSEAM